MLKSRYLTSALVQGREGNGVCISCNDGGRCRSKLRQNGGSKRNQKSEKKWKKSTDEKKDETGFCVMSVQTRSLSSKVITEEEPNGEITGEFGRSSWRE